MKSDSATDLWPCAEATLGDQLRTDLLQKLFPVFNEIVEEERLGEDFLPQLQQIYLPLAANLAHKHTGTPIVIGINGAQGSGKSTLSKILKSILVHGFQKSVLHLSIDDLYLSRLRREQLARDIHPLLKVRGVPGTHDVELGKEILSRLVQTPPRLPVTVPVFDKASDDLLPAQEWGTIEDPVDIVLFEGWCVSARAQNPDELEETVNDLERSEDEQGIWRKYVNKQLAGPYQSLFGFIDHLVMLKVPDMQSVCEWRSLQEEKLENYRRENSLPAKQVMTASEIARFIMYYERITRACLAEMPERAGILLELNKQHQVCGIKVKS